MADLGITFVRPDRRNETHRHGNLAIIRQRTESIFNTANGNYPSNNTAPAPPAGVIARVAQRLLALAATIWHNWTTNAPIKRSLIPYDH